MSIKGCQPRKVLQIASGFTLKALKEMNIGNRIDVDGNALAYKLGSGKPISEVVHLVGLFLRDLAYCGFIVTVIIDGNEHPDYKRATWFRKKDRELDDINRMYCRFISLELGDVLDNQDGETKKDFNIYNSEAKKILKSA